MDVAAVAWLVSDDGRAAVAAATDVRREHPDPLVAAAALRRAGWAAPEAALALTQARLRERARSRFGPVAERFWWTDDGLAQATRPPVSARRAARLAAHGVGHVVDVGCGLGLDALALAAAIPRVTGVERDPTLAMLARANADVAGVALTVVAGDATAPRVWDEVVATGVDAVFADPARRDPAGPRRADGSARRLASPDRWSPPWPWVAGLVGQVPAVVAKLAPGIDRALAPGWETVWTSVDGDLVEAAVWSPALARPGRSRAAVVLRTAPGAPAVASSQTECTDDDDPFGEDAHGGAAPVRAPGAFLCEPDDAVVRAGLVGAVVARCDGWLLDPRIAYVSCDAPPPASCAGLARAYRILARTTTDPARLRSTLQALGARDVVVKRRGVDVDPERVRRAIRPRGDGPTLTVVLSRTPEGAVGLVVEPIG